MENDRRRRRAPGDQERTGGDIQFAYNAAFRRTSMTDGIGTTTYSYDAANRLTLVRPPSGGSTRYTFDLAGNRTEVVGDGGITTTYTHDTGNRVTRVAGPSGTTTYTYDLNGNRISKQDGTGTATYTYDLFDRLTAIANAGGSTAAEYTYNGDGLRVAKTVGATTTRYTWDVAGGLPLVLSDGNDYVWGNGLIGRIQPGSGGNPAVATYAHGDALGSIRLLTDSAGADVGTQRYDEYGQPVAGTGIRLPFGFTGQQFDEESGLVYLRARYLSPVTGQFLTRDPWPGTKTDPASQHGYSYAHNNPLRWTDPTGLCPVETCFTDGLGAGGLGGGPLGGTGPIVITAAGLAAVGAVTIAHVRIQELGRIERKIWNTIRDQLDSETLRGVWKELRGIPVIGRHGDLLDFDHVEKVDNALNGLKIQRDLLLELLILPDLSEEQIEKIIELIEVIDKTLQEVEETIWSEEEPQ